MSPSASSVVPGGHPDVDRRENPPIERHQVRREGDRTAQALLDLGAVAMGEDAVCRQAAVALGKVGALGRRLAGARDAGLRVDDHVRARHEDAGGGQRRQRQKRRGWVTARIGHQPRVPDGLALDAR